MRLLLVIVSMGLSAAGALGAAERVRVEALYGEYCAQCHGPDLRGGQASSLVDGQWQHGASDDAIARITREGLPDQGMVPFGEVLSEEQIRALVVFIREHEARAEQRTAEHPRPRAGQVVATDLASYRVEIVVGEGLELPWAVEPLGDGRYVITERPGRVRVLAADGTLSAPLAGTPEVYAEGQGGMLDVAVHPDYAANGWVYLGFSDPAEVDGQRVGHTALVRGRIDGGEWVDQHWLSRFDRRHYTRGGVHFGTRIVLHDGYVYWTTGDRGRQGWAQELARPNGSVFRLHDDGRVPTDNPFVADPGALPEIFSYGHRNPQGLVWHHGQDALYNTEHGPRGGDELNRIAAGANYGWPVITHGINYNGLPITGETAREGMEQPVQQWTPSPAFCGLEVVDGDMFAAWRGDLLLGALKAQELRRVRLDDAGGFAAEEIILVGMGRIRDVALDSDGSILVVLNGPDVIIRLVEVEG